VTVTGVAWATIGRAATVAMTAAVSSRFIILVLMSPRERAASVAVPRSVREISGAALAFGDEAKAE
jgi:hypothetical protein